MLALLSVMVLFGAITARRRDAKVPASFGPLLIALALAGGAPLGLLVALAVFGWRARAPPMRSACS